MTYTESLSVLQFALDYISRRNAVLGKRLEGYVSAEDSLYRERAEDFLGRYRAFLESTGRPFEFGVECFLHLHLSLDGLRKEFEQTGRYRNTSFEEVNRSVYANPEIMQQHMHGLVFAQFLWPDQYRRFEFFAAGLPQYRAQVKRYLEIGGGHALYVSEAARQLPEASVDVVDISATSLEMAENIAQQPRIRYHLMDVFEFPDGQYDFITMGEVLEHVEQPRELLAKLHRLLTPEGHAYITTPANAPMLDHIYLFRNAREIRQMLQDCGFRIESEARHFGVNIKEDLAERLKLPLMYAAFVAKA